MSRIEELKKQNPHYTIEVIDIINGFFEKPKYTEMVLNLVKNKILNQRSHMDDIISELTREYGFKKDELKSKTNEEINNIFKVVSDYIGYSNFNTVKKFIELNERNLINKNDLTS